jgi:hypothetical protein
MKQIIQPAAKNESAKKPAAKKDNRSPYVTRESVLMLLSDDETAAVATAETATRLPEGDEYLDMEQLEQGVQKAHDKKTPMGRVLPKISIHQDTWNKILKQLPTRSAAQTKVSRQ